MDLGERRAGYVLGVIARLQANPRSAVSPSALQEKTRLLPSALRSATDSLFERGLIERVSADDFRLTASGWAIVRRQLSGDSSEGN